LGFFKVFEVLGEGGVFKYVGCEVTEQSAYFIPEQMQSWVLPYIVGISDHTACRFSIEL